MPLVCGGRRRGVNRRASASNFDPFERRGLAVALGSSEAGVAMVFIVQGKPREPEGIVKVTRQTRKEALETANDFLNEGFPFVTIVGDGRVYTVKEFATTVGNDEPE